MPANSALRVTDINFDGIKQNLRDYLSSQTELQDYDYDSSTIQTLLNVLAYNTYYNAFYTNMIANEMYLDTAIIRSNVVSRAKMLGYTPQSARGSTAALRLTINPTGSPSTITVASNTAFTSIIDGITYNFSTPSSTVIIPDANGNFITTLNIKEGDPVQETYTVSTVAPVKYKINNENADTSTVVVQVQESTSNTFSTNFVLASDLTTVNAISAVYFLQESEDDTYEVLFGNNVLGRNVRDGNLVRLSYKVCNGSTTNGANNFVGPSNISGFSNYSFTVSSVASGGTEKETVESIKFNAPKNYQTQNRAVTVNDYKNILLAQAPDLAAVSVWGGEENTPPIYGKVFVCAKPRVGNILTDQRKIDLTELLVTKNVISIEPEFVDATFLYVLPTVETVYDPNLTSTSPTELLAKVENTLISFETNKLNKFEATFYYSQLLRDIDSTDTSFVGTQLSIEIQKRFIPVITTPTAYFLNFNNPIFNPHPGYRYAISSSSFTYEGFTCFFDDNGSGVIRIYRLERGLRVYVNSNAGIINYPTGEMQLSALLITGFSGDGIKVNAIPDEQNISSIRNQIVLFADANIQIISKTNNTIEARVVNSPALSKTTSTSDIGLNDNSFVY